VPARAPAQEGPPGRDGLPKAAPGHPWKIFNGARHIDRLSYPHGKVVEAARWQLVDDHWEIYSVDSAGGVVVSKWKALNHPLVAYFMGKVKMRCVVRIQPMGPSRSRIMFRADLASRDDITGHPMFGEAKRAYSAAAQKYLIKVRQHLYDTRGGGPPRAGP